MRCDRSTFVPGVIFLIVALAASFLASISLPFLPALEVVRSKFGNNGLSVGQFKSIQEARVRAVDRVSFALADLAAAGYLVRRRPKLW